MSKIDIFLLYNMWTAPYLSVCLYVCVVCLSARYVKTIESMVTKFGIGPYVMILSTLTLLVGLESASGLLEI